MGTKVVIDSFSGPYRFLSNFYPVEIEFGDLYWPTSEHAYQAMKAVNPADMTAIRKASTPGKAKRMGQQVEIWPNWNQIRLAVMQDIIEAKFEFVPEMRDLLLETGDAYLIEGNNWGDTFWGEVDGEGENWLGRIIMQTRSRLILDRG